MTFHTKPRTFVYKSVVDATFDASARLARLLLHTRETPGEILISNASPFVMNATSRERLALRTIGTREQKRQPPRDRYVVVVRNRDTQLATRSLLTCILPCGIEIPRMSLEMSVNTGQPATYPIKNKPRSQCMSASSRSLSTRVVPILLAWGCAGVAEKESVNTKGRKRRKERNSPPCCSETFIIVTQPDLKAKCCLSHSQGKKATGKRRTHARIIITRRLIIHLGEENAPQVGVSFRKT